MGCDPQRPATRDATLTARPNRRTRSPARHEFYVWVAPATAAVFVLAALGLTAFRRPAWVGDSDLAWWRRSLVPDAWWTPTLAVALAIVALVLYRRPRRGQPRSFVLLVLMAMAVTTITLGLAAYLPCPQGQAPVIGPVSWTLGLFVGNVETGDATAACPGELPLGLQLARLLGLATAFAGAVAAVIALGRQQVDRLQARVSGDVDVVVGLDELSLPLAASLLNEAAASRGRTTVRRRRVVLVEPDPAHRLVENARRLGATVIHADPTSVRAMSAIVTTQGGRRRLRRLFAVSGSGAVNRAVALAAQSALAAAPHPRSDGLLPRLVTRFDDPREAESWRLLTVSAGGNWVADAISSDETTSVLLVGASLDERCERLVLVGDTALTYALLREVARRLSEDVTLAAARSDPLAPGGTGRQRRRSHLVSHHRRRACGLRRRHARGLAAAQQLYASAGGSSAVTYEFVSGGIDEVRALLADGTARRDIVIVTEPQSASVRYAAGRLARLSPGVTVHVRADGDLVGLAADPAHDGLRLFGATLLPSASPPEDSWTRLARLQHDVYVARHGGGEASGQGTLVPWSELDESEREDNLRQIRAQIEHVVSVAATRIGA